MPAKPRAPAAEVDGVHSPGRSAACLLRPVEDRGWGDAAPAWQARPSPSPHHGRRCRRCPPRSCSRPGSGAGWRWRCSRSSCLPRWSLQGQTGAVRDTSSTWAGGRGLRARDPDGAAVSPILSGTGSCSRTPSPRPPLQSSTGPGRAQPSSYSASRQHKTQWDSPSPLRRSPHSAGGTLSPGLLLPRGSLLVLVLSLRTQRSALELLFSPATLAPGASSSLGL